MGDVAQILSGSMAEGPNTAAKVEGASALGPPPPPPPSHHPSRAMKLTGMSREVMELLSGRQDKRSAALPPIVPAFPPSGSNAKDTTVKVGNRVISANKPARQWEWAPFCSSARTDGALFRHWVRANVEYPDYPYARFDVHLDPVTYTNDEYRLLLKDPSWTKSDTDKLMELARRYELRWAVIHDRWQEASPSLRRIEDLQHRYYSVAAILTQTRVAKEAAAEVASLSSSVPPASIATEEAKTAAETLVMESAAARAIATAEPQNQPLIATIGTGTTNKKILDLTKERERRAHLELIWNRTKEEEMEEAELRRELRLVDAQIRKLKKSGGHILAASTGGPSSSRNPSRSVTPIPTAAVGPTATAAMATSDSALLDQCFASTAPTPMPQTPYLQSGRLVPPATGGPVGLNKTTLKRMADVLEELEIPQRPIPTKRVCDLYDAVRKDVLTLLTLQKMVIQKEGQLHSKRLKLAKMGGGGRVVDEEVLLGIASTAPASAAGTSASGGTGRGKSSGGSKPKAPRTGGGGKGKTGGARFEGGADSKGSKRGSVKRKKKTDGKSAAAATAGAASAVAGQPAAAANLKGKEVDEGKPSKKRSRKS